MPSPCADQRVAPDWWSPLCARSSSQVSAADSAAHARRSSATRKITLRSSSSQRTNARRSPTWSVYRCTTLATRPLGVSAVQTQAAVGVTRADERSDHAPTLAQWAPFQRQPVVHAARMLRLVVELARVGAVLVFLVDRVSAVATVSTSRAAARGPRLIRPIVALVASFHVDQRLLVLRRAVAVELG